MRKRSLVQVVLGAMLLVSIGAIPVLACSPYGGSPATPTQTLPDSSGGDSATPVLQLGPEYDPVLGGMISQIDESEISRSVSDLQGFSTRVYPSAGNRQAATYLHDRLAALPGLEVHYQSDRYRNVIATLPGKEGASDGVVIVGAHYDSFSSDTGAAPGATDDGGGVAIVLELARVMSRYQFDHTIQFAFWNAEESGLDGSTDYVAYASERSLNIPLYLNFDSGCYDPENEYVLDIMYDRNSEPFAELLRQYNSEYAIGFDLTFNDHRCRSDHISFRKGGYPAITTHSQEHAPEVHTRRDTIELVSPGYARKNAQLGLLLLAGTAGLRSRTEVQPAAPAPEETAPVGRVTASPAVSPAPSPVAVPTVTSAVTPGFAFGTRRYVIGTVPRSAPDGVGSGGTARSRSVGVRNPAIGTGIAKGATPPANRFIRWSPVTRWRASHTV